MTVISDNSPLSALAEIGCLDLLYQLYGKIVIPESVWQEASHPHAPEALWTWLASSPIWLERVPDPPEILPDACLLGAGEAAAISLAWNQHSQSLLLLDDKAARQLARRLELRVTGTGGVLVAAARLGLADFEATLALLQQTSFRLGETVARDLRQRWREETE